MRYFGLLLVLLTTNLYGQGVQLPDIGAIEKTDGQVIVGNGSVWVGESGSTVRDSLGLGASSDVTFNILGLGSAPVSGFPITATQTVDSQGLKIINGSNFVAISVDSSGDIELDGTSGKTLVLKNPVYNDLKVPVTSTRRGGSKDPDFIKVLDNGSGSQGVFSYAFDSGTREELYFSVQLPHTWEEGTTLKVHTHWMPTTTNTGSVVWGLEYSWSNVDSTYSNTTLITGTDAADGTPDKHQIGSIGDIDGTGKEVSSMLLCRMYRDATNVADTYTGDAALLEIDFHIQVDTLGSRSEYSK